MKGNYPTLLLMAGALCIAFLCGYSLGDRPVSAPPAEYVYWEEGSSASTEDPTETSEYTGQDDFNSSSTAGQPSGKVASGKKSSNSSTAQKASSSTNSKVYLSSTTSERESDRNGSSKSNRPVSHEEVKPDPNAIVNINTAGLDELCTLDGIGPVLAQRIIDFRSHAGGFAYVEELLSVSGIGEKKLDAIRDRITV